MSNQSNPIPILGDGWSDYEQDHDRPRPDLLACVCQSCESVRTQDQRWLKGIPIPTGCRISHGICPPCEQALTERVNRLLNSERSQMPGQ